MNKENNILDGFLQRKVEDAQFSFKEDYWQKMSALLDEEEKDKKRPFFWRGLSIFIMVALLSGGTFIYSKWSKNKPQAAKTTVDATPNNQQQKLYVTDNTTTEEATTLPQNTNAENTENITNNTSAQNTTNTVVTNSTSTLQNQEVATISENKNTSKTQKNEHYANHSIVPRSAQSKTKTVSKTIQNSTTPQITTSNLATQKHTTANNTKDAIAVKDNTKNTIQTIANTALQSNNQNIVNIHGKNMIAVDTIVYKPQTPRDDSKYNPRYVASLQNYIPEMVDSIILLNYTPATKNEVSSNTTNSKKETVNATNKEVDKSIIPFIGGGIMFNKLLMASTTNSMGFGISPYLSAGIEKNISSKISLATQIGFTNFNGFNIEKSITQPSYSFGKDSTNYSMMYKKLYQLYLPISIQYNLLEKHQIMASIGAMYQFYLTGNYKQEQFTNLGYSTATTSANYKKELIADEKISSQKGFNPLDVFLQLGYSYQVFSNLSAQLIFTKGFMDMTPNSYYNNTIQHTQTRFSIGIKYSFKRNNK